MKATLFLLLFLPTLSFAQVLGLGKRLNVYQASNSKAYRVGDTIKLAQGSSPNGTFRYVQYGGWLMFLQSGTSEDKNNLERDKSGYGAVIRKIHSFKAHGVEKVVFAVDLGLKSNCDMWIEDAIATCEIVECKGAKVQTTIVQKADDKFDQLKKLKALFDSGAITQAEYTEQKKKLLNQ
ncbi:MAG TPA: SHOCT domain-containing protein [Mucilaginibacter sp.]|nr:SHOCT domain-containing protein [Mucilaginibacter sp.]